MANEAVKEEKKFFIDVVKYRWLYFLISAILIIPGIIAMVYSIMTYSSHTPLKVGIDYTGGTILQYGIDKEVANNNIAIIRADLKKANIDAPVIQVLKANKVSGQDAKIHSVLSIRTQFMGSADDTNKNQVTQIVKNQFPQSEIVGVNSIGPTLGKELFKNSLVALLLAFLGIVAYLSIRFQLDYAIFAILGLVHDVLFILGAFAILGIVFDTQIDALFITALLTVIGFSVHDTIVVYDRVRENLKLFSKKMSFGEIVNFSVNQTLARSINTSLTTAITLAALYFFGGVTTKDFVLAMLLGIIIGTYSSIFFACTLLAWHHEKSNMPNKVAA